jgi:hypothetical protein
VQQTFVLNLTRAADPFRVFFAGGSAFTPFTLTAEEDLGGHPSAPRAKLPVRVSSVHRPSN